MINQELIEKLRYQCRRQDPRITKEMERLMDLRQKVTLSSNDQYEDVAEKLMEALQALEKGKSICWELLDTLEGDNEESHGE